MSDRHAWDSRSFVARYPGTCAKCASAITLGQQILRQSGAYVHADCAVAIAPRSVVTGAHQRWHVNRGVVKSGCPLCV